MARVIPITVLEILPDGTHICREERTGREISLGPGEARVLVPWEPTMHEHVEITDEVYERELGPKK